MSLLLRQTPLLLVSLLACSCASSNRAVDDPTKPTLEVLSPTRGTVSKDPSIIVTGTASDSESGMASVVVNGVEANLDGDQFRASIELGPGTNLIKTVARDNSGNETTDIRATLFGEFASPGPIDNAFAVRLGTNGLATIGQTAATVLKTMDYASAFAAINPVLNRGGNCLGAKGDVTSIDFSNIAIEIHPTPGSLALTLTVDDLAVGMHINFDVACIGGSRNLVTTAHQVQMTAAFEIGVSGGEIILDLTTAEVSLVDVDLGIGGFPTAIIKLIVGNLEDAIADALTEVLATQLEPELEAALGQLTSDREAVILGQALTLSIKPSAISVDTNGLELTATSNVTGGPATTGYVSSPRPRPILSGDFSAALADDTLNQLLGTLWVSGALSRTISLQGEAGTDLGGGIADAIELDALLPPSVGFDGDGAARIEIGDLIVRLSREGQAVTELAVAATLHLSIGSVGNRLTLTAAKPELVLHRLDDDGFLTERDIELLGVLLSSILEGDLGTLVGQIPLPAFAGTSITQLDSVASGGYLTLDVAFGAEGE